jgi:diguanylate cyclase (GGDEF)-like protein
VGILDRARRALNFDADALADNRDRISKHLSGLTAALLAPFFVLHGLAGHWTMASVNFGLIVVLWFNARALGRGRPPPVPFWALVGPLIVAVCVSVLLQGMAGVLWAFPALFMCYFLLPRRLALILSLVLLAAVPVACSVSVGTALALRVFAAMALVLVMINVVLNVVGELQRNLVEQAITDPLTGAYNRRHLQIHLQQLVVPAEAAQPTDSLLAIDIDHFKQVNDRYGHTVGDTVLRGVVATIAARKRSSDLLFRTGGEEFMLLLPRAPSQQALQIAEELRLRLAQATLLPGEPVTVSIGVSTLRAGQSPQAWVTSADKALYEAKRAGRNRVVLAAEDGAALQPEPPAAPGT